MQTPVRALALLGLILAPVGCQDATAVLLDVRTDIPCSPGMTLSTSIAAGTPADYRSKAPLARTTRCDADGKIGTLVLVPSGASDEELAIEVVSTMLPKGPDACRADPAGCVIARRELRFVSHEILTVPVMMQANCLGFSGSCDNVILDGGVSDGAPVGTPDSAVPMMTPPTMPPMDSGAPDGKGHHGEK